MTKNTILVLGDAAEPQLAILKELPDARIIAGDSAIVFDGAASEATIIFNWGARPALLREVFLRCPKLRWMHSRSAGLEKAIFPELVASGVPLTNGKGVFSASLGEFALGAILYFAKDFRRLVRNQMAGIWEQFDVTMISRHTVGIVGYGDIGKAVAARVKPLGMKVLALRRHASKTAGSDPLVDEIYGPKQLAEMLSGSDYVVCATPLTDETRGMIGERELAGMKSNAVLINVGRGPLIQEDALIRALSSGRIKGAALDVFDHEPLPAGHPFYKLENVLLSPHSADHTSDWLDDAIYFFVSQYGRFIKGEPLLNIVDKNQGY